MTPLVTVIIPVYNGEKTIASTLKSVLDQTLSALEVIVINDGSTDKTLEILQQFSDPRLVIHSFENAGLAASRNRGMALAATDYISFIDADDLWTKDKLTDQYQALLSDSQAAVAYSWTHFIDEADNFLYSGQSVTANGKVYQDLLAYNFLESGSNALIRTQALREVGGFDESLTAAEDWDAFLKLAACWSFITVPKVQVYYRISTTSMSANVKRQAQECFKVLERAFERVSDLPASLKKVSFANTYLYLTIKALETQPNRYRSWLALGFLVQIARYQPRMLRERRHLLAIMLSKVMLGLFLNSSQASFVWHKLKQLRS